MLTDQPTPPAGSNDDAHNHVTMHPERLQRMGRTGAMRWLGYVAPELKRTKKSGWYIDFYVMNPVTGKPMRYQQWVNRIVKKPGGMLEARRLVATIADDLRNGWRPWHDHTNVVAARMTIMQAIDKWDETKARQLRHSSPYSYLSMSNVLRIWLKAQHMMSMPVMGFDRSMASRFLTYLSDSRKVGNTTYNNYLQYFKMMFAWYAEREYSPQNPFERFEKRREAAKTRTYLTDEERVEMTRWIMKNNPFFWLPCMFIYGTLIRPGELRRLRVHHVDLKRQVVFLPAEYTKSGNERMSTIPDWMVLELQRMGLQHMPEKAWLVGSSLAPSDKQIGRNTLNRHWVQMRTALGWNNDKQLYSLRDTGIIQLIRDGVDLLHVRDQAGHTDISTTNKYLKHAFPKGPAEIRVKATPMQASSPLVAKPFFE